MVSLAIRSHPALLTVRFYYFQILNKRFQHREKYLYCFLFLSQLWLKLQKMPAAQHRAEQTPSVETDNVSVCLTTREIRTSNVDLSVFKTPTVLRTKPVSKTNASIHVQVYVVKMLSVQPSIISRSAVVQVGWQETHFLPATVFNVC